MPSSSPTTNTTGNSSPWGREDPVQSQSSKRYIAAAVALEAARVAGPRLGLVAGHEGDLVLLHRGIGLVHRVVLEKLKQRVAPARYDAALLRRAPLRPPLRHLPQPLQQPCAPHPGRTRRSHTWRQLHDTRRGRALRLLSSESPFSRCFLYSITCGKVENHRSNFERSTVRPRAQRVARASSTASIASCTVASATRPTMRCMTARKARILRDSAAPSPGCSARLIAACDGSSASGCSRHHSLRRRRRRRRSASAGVSTGVGAAAARTGSACAWWGRCRAQAC